MLKVQTKQCLENTKHIPRPSLGLQKAFSFRWGFDPYDILLTFQFRKEYAVGHC